MVNNKELNSLLKGLINTSFKESITEGNKAMEGWPGAWVKHYIIFPRINSTTNRILWPFTNAYYRIRYREDSTEIVREWVSEKEMAWEYLKGTVIVKVK